MAQIIDTSQLTPHHAGPWYREEKRSLSPLETLQVYCGLDSCLAHEIHRVISPQLEPATQLIYNFERALQAPVLEMMLRGILVDQYEVHKLLHIYRGRKSRIYDIIQKYSFAVWGQSLNPGSPAQLKKFFYEEMGIPKVYIYEKGEKKLSTNRESIEQISQYRYARPIAKAVLAYRDMAKKIGVLESGIDTDGRMRFSWNIGGTNTGRFSCNKNVFGRGTNGQNITDELRCIFVADEGKKFAYLDLEQAESRVTGYISGDEAYIKACECLTKDHEVLTPKGWVSISKMPEVIMTGDFNSCSFAKVVKWNTYDEMNTIEIENRDISIRGTLNHKMPVFAGKFGNIPTVINACELTNYKALVNVPWSGGNKHEPLAALIAAFQAGGHRCKRQGSITFSFSKTHKSKALRTILQKSGLRFSEHYYRDGDVLCFYIYTGQGQEAWPKVCGPEILEWDSPSLKSFCASHRIWDAHPMSGDGWIITSKSEEHISWLATAYSLIGKKIAVKKHKTHYFQLAVKSRAFSQYRSATKQRREKAKVFCPTTKSGMFLVKRKNRIFLSGNSADLHVSVAKLIWPELEWSEKIPGLNRPPEKHDKEIAEEKFWRHWSRRDLSKRGGHLTNYVGQPRSNAKNLHVSVEVMTNFQRVYMTEFSGIKRYHTDVARKLQTESIITTPLGRKRHFFGRNYADDILRKGVAYIPQSTVGDILNFGMWMIWKHLPEVELLAQLHDAVLIQYDDDHGVEQDVIQRARDLMTIAVWITDMRRRDHARRSMTIPTDATVGWNWAKIGRGPGKNPDGLRGYDGVRDIRQRQVLPGTDLLKRIM